jgi:stage IV sporulation protein B
MPLALPDQVHRGNARVITVIHGQRPESFRIKILRTYPQCQPNTKGLLFEVTDRRLLKQAGGVVQGMSGSPIIQGGRVVGAVTHVLLNRPNLGFGCYAYWMATQGVIGPK